MTPGTPWAFGPAGRFRLHPMERRLQVDGEPAAVGARAFDLLLELASRPGELRSKNELIEAVWPGVVVDEGNLTTQISALRKVLGGDVITTIPGRGYRFTARLADASAPPAEGEPTVGGPASPSDPAPASAERLRTNLPAEPPLVFGRAEDLDALHRLLERSVLVTLVGPGGIGKTRLAQAFLHPRRSAYRHGVCWVDLAEVTDPQVLVSALASALGLNLGGGDPLQSLCAAIAPLEMLVALDNAEHLLEAAARVVQAVLEAAPRLRLLVTSQAALRLPAEQVLRLAGLAVPPGPMPARQALSFGAVRLFTERAQAFDARWRLTDENVGGVIEVCSQLDGLALAIELAAARAPVLGVRKLAASMGDRLRLLASSRDRSAPLRQQTLRAALEWSHALLEAEDRTVFRRLAVFAGGGSLELIQQVVADPDGDLDRWAVLDALMRLVDRSLVTVLDAEGGGDPRYRLLDSPQVFALEQLRAADEEAVLRRRHRMAMAAWCESTWHLAFSGQRRKDDCSGDLDRESGNVREALRHALESGESDAAVRIAALRLMFPGRIPMAQRLEMIERVQPHLGDAVPAELRARAWIHIARAVGDSRPDLGLHAARQAVDLLQDRPVPAGADSFLHYLAACTLADAAGRLPESLDEVPLALGRAAALEDPGWSAHRRFYRAVARYLATDADSPEALQRGRELLHLDLAAGGNGLMLRSSLVDAELANGDAEAAVRHGEALLAELQEGRDEEALAFARLNVTAALLALSQGSSARSLALQGWPQGRLFDLQPLWACFLAQLAAGESRPRAAARLAGYAEAAYRAREIVAQANEAQALAGAIAVARKALGDGEFAWLHAEGGHLVDDQIEAIAFAQEDPP